MLTVIKNVELMSGRQVRMERPKLDITMDLKEEMCDTPYSRLFRAELRLAQDMYLREPVTHATMEIALKHAKESLNEALVGDLRQQLYYARQAMYERDFEKAVKSIEYCLEYIRTP